MLYASRLAERLGFIDAATTRRQEELLSLFGLPTQLPGDWPHTEDAVIGRMKLDKKTLGGQLRFVLPKRLGHVEIVNDVTETNVRAVLRRE